MTKFIYETRHPLTSSFACTNINNFPFALSFLHQCELPPNKNIAILSIDGQKQVPFLISSRVAVQPMDGHGALLSDVLRTHMDHRAVL